MNNVSKIIQSMWIVLFGLITIYVIVWSWLYWWHFNFFGGTTIILIWYHIFTSFYSPQWWLWYLPFLIFLIESWQATGLIIVYDILNYIQCPLLFNINPHTPLLVFAVGIRTTLLILIGLLIAK